MTAGAVEPRWAQYRGLVAELAGLTAGPEWTARLDQASADLRDTLDELGVPVTDPEVLYVGLTFVTLLMVQANRAAAQGLICPRSWHAMVMAHRGFVAKLVPFLPAEATA